MLALYINERTVQVLPALPIHTNVPFPQYIPVEMPQYSVDFTSYEPMEPQVCPVTMIKLDATSTHDMI